MIEQANGKIVGGEWKEGKRIKWVEGADASDEKAGSNQRVQQFSFIIKHNK